MESGAFKSDKPLIKALTCLRFFAAVHVILFHMTMNHIGEYPLLVRNFLLAAPIEVGFFFILSGFILTYNYVRKDSRGVDARTFWVARIARVIPVYVLSLVIGLPVLIREAMHSVGGGILPVGGRVLGITLTAFFLLQSWYPPVVHRLNPP